MITEVRHGKDIMLFEIWTPPGESGLHWHVSYDDKWVHVDEVDPDKNLWEVTYDYGIPGSLVRVGRFKTLATALGEAVLYLTE